MFKKTFGSFFALNCAMLKSFSMDKLNIKILLSAGVLSLMSFHQAKAAIINAASVSWADVSRAIASASYGDTVQIPAGTAIWTNSELQVSGITIQGAGTNATYIVDAMPSASIARLFNCVTVANSLTRLTGITFEDLGGGAVSQHGKIEMDARTGGPWRVDHCNFFNLKSYSIFVHGNIGLVDHCCFVLAVTAMDHFGITLTDGYGDVSWATPPTYGTTNELYVEDCYFTNTVYGSSSSSVYDACGGARSVFRHNVVDNTFWANHGTDTSDRYRGTRSFEIYNNTFNDNQSFYTSMDIRSGTGMVYSNTMTGYGTFNSLEAYRYAQPDSPWGQADGTNAWDSSSGTVFFTGTCTATGYNVTCAGANWTVNQWAGYVVNDASAGTIAIGHGAGSVYSCLITSNTTDTLIMCGPKDFQIVFNNGDTFQIRQVLAALDQVGRGSGDLIKDIGSYPNQVTINTATGTSSWPHQVLEPLYSWGNTLNGSFAGITSGWGYVNIQEGRDVYSNAVAPGYVPLVYPHPLNVTGSPTGFSPNTAPTLSPPSDLSVFPHH